MDFTIGLAAFAAVALVGWCIAELKQRACAYNDSEAELQALDAFNTLHLTANDGRELNIDDVMRTIRTKGFTA